MGATIIKSVEGRPVFLRDVARIEDGPADVDHYTRIGFGPAVNALPTIGHATGEQPQVGQERQMVTIAVAKRKGSNAVQVAKAVIASAEKLHGTLIPEDILLSISRDYGETANHKVNELVKHLSFAIVIIVVLLAFSLGLKESFIVSIAVPMTLALTLLLIVPPATTWMFPAVACAGTSTWTRTCKSPWPWSCRFFTPLPLTRNVVCDCVPVTRGTLLHGR